MCKFWHKDLLILSNLFSQPSFSFWPFISIFFFSWRLCLSFYFAFFSSSLFFLEKLGLSIIFTLGNFDYMTIFLCGETTQNLRQNFILKECSPITKMKKWMVFLIGFYWKVSTENNFVFWLKIGSKVKIKIFLVVVFFFLD